MGFPKTKGFPKLSGINSEAVARITRGSKVEKNILETVVQLGSIWLSANVALVTYLALSYMFDRVMEHVDMRARVPAVRRSHNLQIVSR